MKNLRTLAVLQDGLDHFLRHTFPLVVLLNLFCENGFKADFMAASFSVIWFYQYEQLQKRR